MKQLRIFSTVIVALLIASLASAQTVDTQSVLKPTKTLALKEYKVISYNVRLSMAADTDGDNRW